jgi:hypothetical protein
MEASPSGSRACNRGQNSASSIGVGARRGNGAEQTDGEDPLKGKSNGSDGHAIKANDKAL